MVGKVLFYNAGTGSKIDSLRRVLEGTALKNTGIVLEEVTAKDFIEKMDDDVVLLVLPGARAGTPYREQLKGAAFDHMKAQMEKGLHVLGICAGAFVLAQEFEYHDYDTATGALLQTKKMKSELGIAAAEAFGPDLRLYPLRPREADNPWSVYTAAPVTMKLQGDTVKGALALSRGPSFLNVDPEKCDVIATYDGTGDAAIVSFRHGKGGGVLSGPALEVGGGNLVHYIHPDHYKDPHCRGIVTTLEESRDAWARLWIEVLEKLLPDQPAVQAQIRRNFGVAASPAAAKSPKLPAKYGSPPACQ